ncbi:MULTISPECIES: hypothetical protein [unclassified Pseudomonas]|uniref:hypothetical protein n=1 Tax=unclassified Pseudomonas TaxID=196821 RepID=UPI00101262CF|nr:MULTISPECIES: hypothetical protein [unclassified Pseudomonas]KAA0983264.1 hypothetical protein FQ187_12675 [Pseudomonas sp. ANT_J28]QAY93702.1 hypothetical protein CUN63_29535 [Pseudomonas sp. ACM7]
MSKPAVKDVLDEMTKDDLVSWIRNQHFMRPKQSDVLYIRWERQSGEVLEEMQRENRALDGVDFKERDRLAGKFNDSKDPEEKLRLLKQIEPYDKAMSEHIKRTQALDRKSKKVDSLYEQIDVERQKERGRRSA